jgi:curved DNA-binding protein CbpA
MDAVLKLSVEIDTLHEILGELDYYRLFQVSRDAEAEAIGEAFRRESRRLHPDRAATLEDEAVRERANTIYKVVNEAWKVLKDPEERARYDQLLSEGILRMTDEAKAGAQSDKRAGDPEAAATHPKAEKYWKMALRDWADGQFKSCVMNIQFALTFEPANETFKEWMEKATKARDEEDSKKEKNPYKLRLS